MKVKIRFRFRSSLDGLQDLRPMNHKIVFRKAPQISTNHHDVELKNRKNEYKYKDVDGGCAKNKFINQKIQKKGNDVN